MARAAGRVTQRQIAQMTGVSQATVSLVLNGRDDADIRIAPETRERVMEAIRSTGYSTDSITRRLATRHNRVLSIFTCEATFPAGQGDFYHPFLVGIAECAERVGCDLLLLTSAPVVNGRRRIFDQDNRLRIADGSVLLGGTIAPDELARLVADRRPFVSIGRRDDAGGPVPYVGVDYPSATAALVRRAVAAGHRTLAYAGEGEGSESYADRKQGFAAGVAEANVDGLHLTVAGRNPDGVLDELRRAGATAVFVEDYADGVALAERAVGRGLAVPGHLSIVMLGDPIRPVVCDIDFTGLRIPRLEMGRQAVEIVDGLVQGLDVPTQRLLAAEIVDGVTLGPVHVPTAGAPRTNRRRVSVD